MMLGLNYQALNCIIVYSLALGAYEEDQYGYNVK